MTYKKLFSTYQFVQTLKQKKLLPFYISDFIPLPPDPEKRIFLIHIDPKFVLGSACNQYLSLKKEDTMHFHEVIEEVNKGKKASRAMWRSDEYIFAKDNILFHTHPYWQDEEKNETLSGYPFITEYKDVIATDWMVHA